MVIIYYPSLKIPFPCSSLLFTHRFVVWPTPKFLILLYLIIKSKTVCIDCHSSPTDPEQLLWALITLSVVSVLFCALCLCRLYPKIKQFLFESPEDRRGSGQPPAPNYSKSKSASICSTSQLPVNLLNVKRGSNAQHFQPISIEVNQSSPTPPATNQPSSLTNLSQTSNRRLSAINISTIQSSTSPTLSNNLATISGHHVPYSHSPQPTNKNQQLRAVAVQSSSAINELGLVSSTPQQQQQASKTTPRTRASISNLLMSPKLTDFNYQLDSSHANNNDFEFKNLNLSASSGLRVPPKQRKYSCVAAIAPIDSQNLFQHANYLPNQLPGQLPRSRRHSRAVTDLPSPSQLARNQERKQSNIKEHDLQQQSHYQQNERPTSNRKKYSLASHNNEFNNVHLINKPLVQTQQEHSNRKYSNSSTPNSSRKQSRIDIQQIQQFMENQAQQQMQQDYNQEYNNNEYEGGGSGGESYHQNAKYGQKRHSASHQHYLPVNTDIQQQQQDHHFSQYESEHYEPSQQQQQQEYQPSQQQQQQYQQQLDDYYEQSNAQK